MNDQLFECEICDEAHASVMDRGVGYFCNSCNAEYEINQAELQEIIEYEKFHRG